MSPEIFAGLIVKQKQAFKEDKCIKTMALLAHEFAKVGGYEIWKIEAIQENIKEGKEMQTLRHRKNWRRKRNGIYNS